MITVTLSYPNGNRQDVFLKDVPRVGDSIQLAETADQPSLAVEHVLWVEGTAGHREPTVLVKVRPRAQGIV